MLEGDVHPRHIFVEGVGNKFLDHPAYGSVGEYLPESPCTQIKHPHGNPLLLLKAICFGYGDTSSPRSFYHSPVIGS